MKNKFFNYSTLILIYLTVLFIIYSHFNEDSINTITSYLGLAVMVISLFFFTVARINLGNSFKSSAEANSLVTHGIYKVIRHPIYVFGVALSLGIFLFLHFYYGIIFIIAIIAMQKKRIRNEEAVLQEKFGDKYIKYKKLTWF